MLTSTNNGDQTKARHRSVARLISVQALYEISITNAPVEGVLKEFLSQRWVGADEDQSLPFSDPDERFMGELIKGVISRLHEIDGIIQSTLKENHSFNRFEILLQSILRAGTFELMECLDVPPLVVINEYVDVTHAFFDDSESHLVNGILDKLARKLRLSEMKEIKAVIKNIGK